jgi:hypothetical protein
MSFYRRIHSCFPSCISAVGLRMAVVTGTFSFLLGSPVHATVYPTSPTPNADKTCVEDFETKANLLQPGDTLIVNAGTYSQGCRRLIHDIGSDEGATIYIQANAGAEPILTHPRKSKQNNLDLENVHNVVIRGLHFQGGETGINILSGSNITIDDSEIYETLNNAIRANTPVPVGNEVSALTISNNRIHHTGLAGGAEGEGMYLGCHDGSCLVTNSTITNNDIHHLRAGRNGSNDGIEIKYGSHGNTISDNVIHDANIGRLSPCIIVYGGQGADTDPNIVESNTVWNCGEGIYAVSDAVVQNNLILQSTWGLSSYPHAIVPGSPNNLRIVNNTIFKHTKCLYLRWTGAQDIILANNAVYCPGTTAVDAVGVGSSGVTSLANYYEGSLLPSPADNPGFVSGGAAAAAFVNVDAWNLLPAPDSVLRENADADFLPADENGYTRDYTGRIRDLPPDVGACDADSTDCQIAVGPPPRHQLKAAQASSEERDDTSGD